MDEDSRKIDETQDQLEIPAIDGRRDISPRAVVQLFGLNPVSRMRMRCQSLTMKK